MDFEKLKQNKSIKELLEFGIINFDKPATLDPARLSLPLIPRNRSDCTSFDVVDFVRRKLKLRKASHFGTLDPMVTGVLPIALNRAVKLSGFFIGEDKEYEGVMRIHEDVSLDEIRKTIKEKFLGKIIQLPPVRSRVKRQKREREIKNFELLEKDGKNISFRVECQGGTYIRKLIYDLGEEMGIGAHMIKLRRIRAGIFKEKDSTKRQKAKPLASSSLTSQTKEDFEKAVEEYFKGDEKKLREMIIPAEIVSEIYPSANVKKEHMEKILHGAPIDYKFLIEKKEFEKGQIICIFEEEKFIGMYKIINEKNVFAKPEFVLQP